VRLLFLDESGRIGQDGLFALGGVTVRADEWRLELDGELLQVCAFTSDARSGRIARPSRRA